VSGIDLRAADGRARRIARGEFGRPIVLEAGAGTGKTSALVARVATWTLTLGWEKASAHLGAGAPPARIAERTLERVAMITFTEKAAVEMERRIGAAFRDLSGGTQVKGLPVDELRLPALELRQRAAALGAALDRLQVRTIHGFCSGLLSTHALAAGLHPAFTVDADQSAVRRLSAEVVSEALPSALGADPDSSWIELLTAGKGPNDVAHALRILVEEGASAADLRRDPYSAEDVRCCAERLAALAREAASILDVALPAPVKVHLEPIAAVRDALREIPPALSEVRDITELQRALAVDAKVLDRIAALTKAPNKTEQKALGASADRIVALCAELAPSMRAIAELDVGLARAARSVLAPLLDEVDRRRRARGTLTFLDLLVEARDLLRDDEATLRAVRSGLDQLLVDEFQDTDDVQCEIVRRIALEEGPAERPGLFLVGDPKQSIYGWRRADLRAYESLCEAIVHAGGTRELLAVNYRSSQVVLDEIQRLVEPVMLHEPGVQPQFAALLEGREKADPWVDALLCDGRASIEHWSSATSAAPASAGDDRDAGETNARAARALEARSIARELLALRAAGVDLGQCAILLRQLTEQETYVAALREHGIPYAVGRDREFYRTREIAEAIALASAILDPSDALALLTLLRSPLGGVPDAALAPLWRAGMPELCARLNGMDAGALAMAEAAVERAAAEARAALRGLEDAGLDRIEHWPLVTRACLRALHGLRRAFAEEPADRAVEQLRAWLLPEVVEAARFPGPYRLANLERFLRELAAALGADGQGPHDVLRELISGLAGDVERESAPPGDAALGAVRILSIHSAKGLEFANVWLADLHHGNNRRERERERTARVERGAGGLEIELFETASLQRAELATRRKTRECAEQARLLYVAATRAKDRLVLTGLPGKADGKDGRLSDLVAQRTGVPAPWNRLAEAVDRGEAPWIDADGAHWRLLAAEPQTSADFDAESDEDARPGVSQREARAIAAEARAARTSASARAARPWIQAASADPEDEEREARDRAEGTGLSRSTARAVGVAVHAALERWDPAQTPDQALRVALERLDRDLSLNGSSADRSRALGRARELLERFARSQLGARLAEIAPRVVARELPLALAAGEGDVPSGAFVGAADLVYSETEGLVVADFKTDAEPDEALLAARYAPQLERYAQALRRALGVDVRTELWLVDSGRITALARS
jgi:ATP-dependent exoDNAse (exonuclease V) beta subunit